VVKDEFGLFDPVFLTIYRHIDNCIVVLPEGLFQETELLFQTLKKWSETLHSGLGISPAARGVLDSLLVGGPAPVPSMARERGVSRQRIQQQVDLLLARGLVERQGNPAHKRSSIIALTDKGRGMTQNMRADELKALSRMQVGVSDHAVRDAAQVLSAWQAALQRDMAARL
jgi:DNA-binding MarR family transcriptional regulator